MRDLTFEQSCIIAGYGIVTALNFMSMGWTCRNNYTACYPSNTDVKDYFIPVSRMFDWIGNTVIRTFWSKLDKPMTRRFADSILDTCNIWLNGLVGMERLLGARAEMLASENNLLDLMAGILKIHIYMTPPSPAQEFWEVETAEVDIWADKFVVICRPKEIAPGTVAPMATADTKGTFAVYYYAAYKNGKQLWEIDKRNMKCVINGVDHMAPVRRALGK